MTETTLKGRKIVKGCVEGYALVSHEDICFLLIDVATGIITEKNHELEGSSVAGKILVFPTGKGSTSGSYVLYEMAGNGTAPSGIINLKAEPITAIGAILSNIPMIDEVKPDPTQAIKTGDYVDLDCNQGVVRIRRTEGVATD